MKVNEPIAKAMEEAGTIKAGSNWLRRLIQ
jgi:hypothetical protein